MLFKRVEKELEEVGVFDFLAHHTYGFKNIEAKDFSFQLIKISVIDDESFEKAFLFLTVLHII